MKDTIYYKDGKKYRKIGRNEVIQEGAMMTWRNGELQPIFNSDGKTVGSTPSQYSNERDFYNPVEELDIQKAVEFMQVDPDNVILHFHCPNHCSMEIRDVPLSNYLHSGHPTCFQCDDELVYNQTTLRKEN